MGHIYNIAGYAGKYALCFETGWGGGRFDHFIVLSEQCIPIKTKQYIKAHLAKYKGKSFCASFNFVPEIPFPKCPRTTDAFRLTRYYYTFLGGKGRSTLNGCLKDAVHVVLDCFYYAVPILLNMRETLYRMACTYPFRTLYRSRDSLGEKIKFVFGYIMCFPWRFIVYMLCGRETWIGNYGKKSKLLSFCTGGEFRVTKSSGPSACYCREDVEFLCRPENIKLAKSMRRYFGPEEYFCQTLLHNSAKQKKNFLNESLCATDYFLQDANAVLNYLEGDKFPTGEFCDVSKDYHFQHICFLRKINDPKIWDFVEGRLALAQERGQKEK